MKFLELNQQKKLLLSKWKEGKISDDKVNNIAINRALLIGERDGCKSDLSAKDMLKLAATEIEERANTRLKVSIWKQQKEREKEEFSVSIFLLDILCYSDQFMKLKT